MYRMFGALILLGGIGHTLVPPVAPDTVRRGGHVVLVKAVDVSPTAFRFEPSDVTAQAGDTIRIQQTGTTPHNVEFRETAAGANLGDAMMGPFLTAPGETYDLVLNARFTAGAYKFVCTPHEPMGMHGTLTIRGQ